MSFQFLNPMVAPGDIGRQNSEVRSVVMKRVRKERVWSSRGGKRKAIQNRHLLFAPAGETTSSEPVEMVMVLEESSSSASSSLYARPPELAAQTIDPFWTLPIQQNPKTAILLHHYITIMSPLTPKFGKVRAIWFSCASNRPALLHGLLCTAALHRYTVGIGTYEDAIETTSAVARQVNNNLTDPEKATGLENIMAVMWLFFISCSPITPPDGSGYQPWAAEQQPLIHLRALQSMLEIIGGLRVLMDHRLVYISLLWFQTQQALRYRFVPNSGGIHADSQTVFQGLPLPTKPDTSLEDALSDTVDELRGLSMDVEAWNNENGVPFDSADLLQRCSLITVHLLQMFDGMTVMIEQTTFSPRQQVLLLGCLIFTGFLFDGLNFNSQLLQVYNRGSIVSEPLAGMGKQLRIALYRAEWLDPLPYNLKLWAVVLGATVSNGTPDRLWFENQLIELCVEGNLNSAEEMIEVLMQTVWLASDFSWHASELWNTVISS